MLKTINKFESIDILTLRIRIVLHPKLLLARLYGLYSKFGFSAMENSED